MTFGLAPSRAGVGAPLGLGDSPTARGPDLGLYNVVYISPLLAVATAHRQSATPDDPATARWSRLLARARAAAALCSARGTIIGCAGVAAALL